MNQQTWSTIGVIFGIFLGAVTIFFLARSSSNETKRRSDEARDKAVEDAKAPLLATIERLQDRLDAKDVRIGQLEDQLRTANARGTS